MYERSAIVLERYFEKLFSFNKDNNLKICFQNYENLLSGLDTYKEVITKEEIDRLLLEIPEINTIDLGEKQIEQEYKELMKSGTHEDLVKIIKTSYLRNQIRILNNKRISEIDDEYFRRAEKYLYEEIGIVLNLSFENTKEYIINKLKKAN